MAYVRDIMKTDVITAKGDSPIPQISKVLTENNISNIPVKNDRDELIGIVSEQDIIRAMQSEDFMQMKVKDIMTRNVRSVKENDCLEYVSKIFLEHPYRRLPVTRNKKVVGIITREDIINSFMSHYY